MTTTASRSDQIADAFLSRAVLLNRVASGLINEVGGTLPLLRASIVSVVVSDPHASGFVVEMIRAAFSDLSASLQNSFAQVLRSEIRFAAGAFGVDSGVADSEPLPDLLGAPIADWIQAVSDDLSMKVLAALNIEMATGPLAIGVDFLLDLFTRMTVWLETLIRTMINRLQNWAIRTLAPLLPGDFGWIQISILDSRTSEICRAYAQKIWTADFKPIGHSLAFKDGAPRHWNCRSMVVPLFAGDRQRDLTFDSWLGSLKLSEREDLFGAKALRLFERKLLSVSDLVKQATRGLAIGDL